MDPHRFDRLTKSLSSTNTRRRLMGLVAALPLAGAFGGLLGVEGADGQGNGAGVGGGGGRRRRRRGRHHPGQDKDNRKDKHNKKKQPQCTPDSVAQTCANTCGSVINNCQQPVDCGSCTCAPACDVCFTCEDGSNTPGACVVDPAQEGDACGSGGKVCQSDGACTCIPLTACPAGKECGTISDGCAGTVTCPATCGNPTPICTDNVCVACASGQCASGEVCDAGSCKTTCTTSTDCGDETFCDTGLCEACDVCASGCTHTTVQAAIDAAIPGSTIHICAGTYGRSNGASVASIIKDLTLVGAGHGAAGTILDGGGGAIDSPVVGIINVTTVELRDLTVTGGNGRFQGMGGMNVVRSGVTLTQVESTGNTAGQGGGISNDSPGKTLTLTDCTLSQNHAGTGGGLLNLAGTVVMTGTTVSGNTATRAAGGILNGFGQSMTLTSSTVRGNSTPGSGTIGGSGGGIYNNGLLTLTSTQVTLNTAPAGAGITNRDTVTIGPGSSVTLNIVGDCLNQDGGTGCPPA